MSVEGAASMRAYLIGPETERLTHRAMTVDDAPVFYALKSHPEVIRYTGEPAFESLEAAREAIEGYPDFKKVGFGRWGCVLKSSGEMIGFCGLKYLDDLDAVDVGYRFFPEYWGRGLATEACAATLAFGFEMIGLERIIGLVLDENAASIRVLEKCGMRPAGRVDYEGCDALMYEALRAR